MTRKLPRGEWNPFFDSEGGAFAPRNQRETVALARSVLETATQPVAVVDTPYSWRPDDKWTEPVYDESH